MPEVQAAAATATTQAGIATTKAGEASTSASTATTQAGTATTKAGEASTSAGIATTKAEEASTSAATATTQAGIATTKAGEASTSAGIATTQAGTATTKAGEAAASAAAALVSEQNAAATLANAVTKATYDAKGDLLVGTGADAYTRLPVGANGTIPVADSASGTGLKWSTAAAAGIADLASTQTITGAKTLTAPTFVGTAATTGGDFAPALSTWTGANGATWDGSAWTIPAGGTISATITLPATAGIYHVTLTRTGGTGSTAVAALGGVVAETGSATATVIPIQSVGTGPQLLVIGGGTWAAVVSGVAVQLMTPAGPRSQGFVLRAVGSNVASGTASQRSLTTGSGNVASGTDSQRSLTTGSGNVASGYESQRSLTTSNYNVASGHISQRSLTTGSGNVASGTGSQYSLTTGSGNVASGTDSQRSLTTSNYNVASGYGSQYSPRGVTAWATTTASRQTSIGHESGQGSSSPSDEIVTIGYRAIADGAKAMALGSMADARHPGSVALGSDTITTATGQVAVGARDVEVQDATKGLVLRSPDGSRWRATISNAGVIAWTKLA